MLLNYLTTAARNFLRQPFYSAINVLGLVLGLTCSIFIFLWVLDELSYDRYHPDNDRVYKVSWNSKFADGHIVTDDWTSGLLAEALKIQIPEVEQTARAAVTEPKLFKSGETANYERGYYADKSLFEVLNLTLLYGNKASSIPDNNSMAISRKMAKKYFKDEPALGKVFRVDNKMDFAVSAVFEDIPQNATLTFEFILPFEVYIKQEFGDVAKWDGNGWQNTYVKLRDKSMRFAFESKLAEMVKKNEPPSTSPPPPPFLFPMTEWRLHDSFIDAKQSGGRISYVVSFSLVAVLILIIACINFMNLSTARSVNRSREVGIRKVAGASRGAIIRQFLSESILLSFLSLIVALIIVHFSLPIFNSFTEKNLVIHYIDAPFTFGLLGITVLTGIIAGSYPAFFLSSFRPASVLKGNLQSAFSGKNLRRGLVVFQFALSIVIVVSTLVVNDQINFMRNKNLGFDKDNVLSLTTNEDIFKHYEVFRNELLQSRSITSVAIGDAHPMEINGQGYYEWNGKSADDDLYFNQAHCDDGYLPTLGFTFTQGRNFSPNIPSDSSNFVITEAAANHIGFANPIGQRLWIFEDNRRKEGQIIGVIKDFHNASIQDKLHPTVFSLGRRTRDFGRWANVFVRYERGRLPDVLNDLNRVYVKHSPNFPIQYGFVDEEFEKQFKLERTIASLSLCFTILAIVISCLGLFGLASFSAERRAKEIGVRKVLGASVSGLVVLLCRDFTKLVVYSIILGSPIAYYAMDKFLNDYPYHTQLGASMFLIPALAMLLISLAIIAHQSVKAAISNPVEVLRSE